MMSQSAVNRQQRPRLSVGLRRARAPCHWHGSTGLPMRWVWIGGVLLALPDQDHLPVAAVLDHKGAHALEKPDQILQPVIEAEMVAMRVKSGIGDYRSGDDVWLSRRTPVQYADVLNRDVLIPRPAGRYLFGRLIGREGDQLQILPLGSGTRQQIVKDPEWIGVAVRLVREL